MGRSVSVPGNAALVAYDRWQTEWTEEEIAEVIEELGYDPSQYEWCMEQEWKDYLDWVEETAMRSWPSLQPVDEWQGEFHVLLENSMGKLGVSEYMGVVAICFIPNPDNNFSQSWATKILHTFHREFGSMIKLGTFSNGESVYTLKATA